LTNYNIYDKEQQAKEKYEEASKKSKLMAVFSFYLILSS